MTLAKIKVHLVLSSGKDKLCEIIWYMGVIPLPVIIKARSISIPKYWRRDDLEPTSSDSDSVSKLVGLVLVLDDRSLEGEGLTRFEVGDVLGHLSGL